MCFRYHLINSFAEFDNLTFPQYEILLKAKKLENVDKDYRNHLQAFLNYSVQAQRKVGKSTKPVYREFKQFYNYDKEIEDAEGKKKPSRFSSLSQYLKQKGESNG